MDRHPTQKKEEIEYRQSIQPASGDEDHEYSRDRNRWNDRNRRRLNRDPDGKDKLIRERLIAHIEVSPGTKNWSSISHLSIWCLFQKGRELLQRKNWIVS